MLEQLVRPRVKGVGMVLVYYAVTFLLRNLYCNSHYNRMPDLGKYVMWGNMWDLARHTILDSMVLDRNVTWLTKHKDTS